MEQCWQANQACAKAQEDNDYILVWKAMPGYKMHFLFSLVSAEKRDSVLLLKYAPARR